VLGKGVDGMYSGKGLLAESRGSRERGWKVNE
jgi:hypothetical protein